MKKNKIVILTTHSMEEADALADKVVIMGRGTVRCVGPSFKLKRLHGGGYMLNLIGDDEEFMKKLVQKNVPFASISSSNSGNIIFRMPYGISLTDIVPLMKEIENEIEKGSIRDYSFSLPTLQQVYVSVTKESKFSYEENTDLAFLPKDEEKIKKLVKDTLPLASFVSSEVGKIQYKFPIGFTFKKVLPLVEEIESNLSTPTERKLIHSYSIDKTNLHELNLTITQELNYKEIVEIIPQENVKLSIQEEIPLIEKEEKIVRSNIYWSQFRGLCLKSCENIKSTKAICCW